MFSGHLEIVSLLELVQHGALTRWILHRKMIFVYKHQLRILSKIQYGRALTDKMKSKIIVLYFAYQDNQRTLGQIILIQSVEGKLYMSHNFSTMRSWCWSQLLNQITRHQPCQTTGSCIP